MMALQIDAGNAGSPVQFRCRRKRRWPRVPQALDVYFSVHFVTMKRTRLTLSLADNCLQLPMGKSFVFLKTLDVNPSMKDEGHSTEKATSLTPNSPERHE